MNAPRHPHPRLRLVTTGEPHRPASAAPVPLPTAIDVETLRERVEALAALVEPPLPPEVLAILDQADALDALDGGVNG